MVDVPVLTSNSKEVLCMVCPGTIHFWTNFNRHFLYRVAGGGFKKRCAFLITAVYTSFPESRMESRMECWSHGVVFARCAAQPRSSGRP